jgi:hypothetical protein
MQPGGVDCVPAQCKVVLFQVSNSKVPSSSVVNFSIDTAHASVRSR